MSQRVKTSLMVSLVFVALIAGPIRADESVPKAPLPHPAAIIPQPVVVASISGQPFVLDGATSVKSRGAVLPECLGRVVRSLRTATGIELKQAPGRGGAKAASITLRLDRSIGRGQPAWQAAEAYKLAVMGGGSSVEIAASDAHGLFNGTQTLVQLAEKGADGKWRVPPVRIEDYPRFQWRGYLLDPARHFRTKEELFRYIDLMALHKLNVMQLHLTDNQGWRVEIKRYPKLTEVGAELPDSSNVRAPGRFYPQVEIGEIVAYAGDRYIRVVPEIEMPGHSGAATTSYPEVACEGKPSAELCPTNEATFQFVANVLDEIAAMFPSPYIHVGADEVEPDRWRACPRCRKRMDELAAAGLPEGVKRFRVILTSEAGRPFQEDISKLEGEFVRRLDAHLTKKGRRMVGWDEVLEGGLAADSHAVVAAWRSPTVVAGATEQGRDVVVSLYPEYYLDNDTPLAQTYAVEPVPADLPETQARHVLGVQANMWGESTPTQQSIDLRTFPRLCALAEVGWSPKASRDFKDFTVRLDRHAERLRPYGISFPRKVGE